MPRSVSKPSQPQASFLTFPQLGFQISVPAPGVAVAAQAGAEGHPCRLILKPSPPAHPPHVLSSKQPLVGRHRLCHSPQSDLSCMAVLWWVSRTVFPTFPLSAQGQIQGCGKGSMPAAQLFLTCLSR
jgi:hypothetical protein